MMTQQWSSTSILFFRMLAHLKGDLSQAEQMHKMATISLKMVEVKIVVILSVAQIVTTGFFLS